MEREREIGVRRMRLKSHKIRYDIDVQNPDGSFKYYVCVDGADVICHMFEELASLHPGATIKVHKLTKPKKFT